MAEKTVPSAEGDAEHSFDRSKPDSLQQATNVRGTVRPTLWKEWVETVEGDVVVTDRCTSETSIFDPLAIVETGAARHSRFIVMSGQNTIPNSGPAAETCAC